ncbi:MAG TPA: YihY/virulence factor BrkB family protein [Vicinamibacterales bacterium]
MARPLIALLRTAWHEYERDHAGYLASAMVYYALISLLPLLLLLLAVLGLLLRHADFAVAAEQQVLYAVEAHLGLQMREALEQLFAQLQQESLVASVLSLIGVAASASVLFRHLRLSFRAIWHVEPVRVSGSLRAVVRTMIREYATAYMIALSGGGLLLLALAAVSITQWIGGLLTLPGLPPAPSWLITLPNAVLTVGLAFALLLKHLPPVPLQWRDVWLASALCTVAWLIAAEAVVLAGALLGHEPSATGALGSVLVAMLWINLVSQLLFFGAEVSKVVARQRLAAPRGSPVP